MFGLLKKEKQSPDLPAFHHSKPECAFNYRMQRLPLLILKSQLGKGRVSNHKHPPNDFSLPFHILLKCLALFTTVFSRSHWISCSFSQEFSPILIMHSLDFSACEISRVRTTYKAFLQCSAKWHCFSLVQRNSHIQSCPSFGGQPVALKLISWMWQVERGRGGRQN